jgi:tetratricopeptide (TPR) repeat protein
MLPKKMGDIDSLTKKGKSAMAIKAAKALLAKDPKNADARYMLGKAYLAARDEDAALAEFKNLTESGDIGEETPEEEFRKTLAGLFVSHKMADDALKEYVLLIKLNPQEAEYYYWAGKLLLARNKADKATGYLQKAAQLSPRDPKIFLDLGVLFYKMKNPGEAKPILERALKLRYDAEAFYYLGKIQKDAKDYQSALSTFEKCARDQNYRVKALLERGSCLMAMNHTERAIPDLERAAKSITNETAPESLYARYYLGLCYEKIRELDKACEQWAKVKASKKDFKDVEAKLAQYKDMQSDTSTRDFLSANQQNFMQMCMNMITSGLALQVKQSQSIQDGGEFIAIENDSEKWRNTKKMPRLIRIFRSSDPVGDDRIRSILDDMKDQNMIRCMAMSSSGFTDAAKAYAESRSVELVDKDKLQALLRK